MRAQSRHPLVEQLQARRLLAATLVGSVVHIS
jgi:hypothetical protein